MTKLFVREHETDHKILDITDFRGWVKAWAEQAARGESITVCPQPGHPSFGYICLGEQTQRMTPTTIRDEIIGKVADTINPHTLADVWATLNPNVKSAEYHVKVDEILIELEDDDELFLERENEV